MQKKRFGGGRRDLENTKLPIELQLLFENKYIECIQLLVVLFANKSRRKGIEFLEVLYYFTLLSSTTKLGENEYHLENKYIQNNYLSYEKKVRDNLIVLANQELVSIKVELLNKRSLLFIKVTEQGKKIIAELENEYYIDEIAKANYLIKFRKYSTKSEKGVLMGDEE